MEFWSYHLAFGTRHIEQLLDLAYMIHTPKNGRQHSFLFALQSFIGVPRKSTTLVVEKIEFSALDQRTYRSISSRIPLVPMHTSGSDYKSPGYIFSKDGHKRARGSYSSETD